MKCPEGLHLLWMRIISTHVCILTIKVCLPLAHFTKMVGFQEESLMA